MAIDLFGKKARQTITDLSYQMVEQSKEFKTAMEQQYENQLQLVEKAASNNRLQFLNSFNNFNTQIFPHYNVVREQLIYQTVDEIYSVVSRLAQDAAKIPFYGEYRDGTELKGNDKLHAFLNTLTYEQKIIAYTYLLTKGEVFGYKEKIEFGVNKGLSNMRLLNPDLIVVVITDTFPTEVVGYKYFDSIHGLEVYIDIEDMMFFKLFNPSSDINEQTRGLSPIRVLKQRVARLQGNMDVSVAQMQNGGLPGIVYEKTLGIEVGAMDARKDNFARYQNNSANKGAPFMTHGDLGYIAIGSSLADLTLTELASIDLDAICNVYHVSSTNFNNKSASTESNVKTHDKSYYTAGVMPLVMRFRDALNMQVLIDIDTKAILKEDISDIEELQGNMLEKAQAIAAAPSFVVNESREALGQKRLDDPNADRVFVKTGYTLLEDIATPVEDVPNTAGDYVPPVPPKK